MRRCSNLRWDVFCRVVDNYGDAAVCWRLARELAARDGSDSHGGRPGGGGRVRLWLDDLAVLRALCPDVDPGCAQQRVAGVEILRWDAGAVESPASNSAMAGSPADIVVEGFGCGLPDAYAQAMARRSPASLWITLEYLSAEAWVASHHRLPSPHPRLPLERYFFFPGFTPDTGGLLKEAGLDARREAFVADPQARAAFWRRCGFAPVADDALAVSLFGYENPAAASLLEQWANSGAGSENNGRQLVVAAVPPGRLRPQVLAVFDAASAVDGAVLRRGKLEVRLVPFLPQLAYDELLWSCDWNFVRGEDSFVRAQWAARPLVWHIYAQAESAHRVKLDAFLNRWCAGLDAAAAQAVRQLWHAWNAGNGGGTDDCGAAWAAVAAHRERLALHACKWAKGLDLAGNLAEKLAQFCADRLKSPAS